MVNSLMQSCKKLNCLFIIVSSLLKGQAVSDLQTNDSTFSDRQVWVNSVDPDQTAPTGDIFLNRVMKMVLFL